jgi:hypothetical protein
MMKSQVLLLGEEEHLRLLAGYTNALWLSHISTTHTLVVLGVELRALKGMCSTT